MMIIDEIKNRLDLIEKEIKEKFGNNKNTMLVISKIDTALNEAYKSNNTINIYNIIDDIKNNEPMLYPHLIKLKLFFNKKLDELPKISGVKKNG